MLTACSAAVLGEGLFADALLVDAPFADAFGSSPADVSDAGVPDALLAALAVSFSAVCASSK